MSIRVTADSTEKEAIKEEINEEIRVFEEWFTSTVEDSPLMRVEASILRTFLQWKLLSKE